MDSLHRLYRDSLALLTDLYQLTMAYGYWRLGRANLDTTFHLFFRSNPFQGGFSIASGLRDAVEFIKDFRFASDDLEYLGTIKGNDGQPLFPERGFFDFLSELRLTCDVDAIVEGTAVFPNEPLIRVRGPILQCQLLETPLLNLINFPTLVATKAARVCLAAKGDPVLEFGTRRAQGVDGSLAAARAAYVGGCAGTSNVLAGKLFGIPVGGTHAHSWVMSFDSELESFDAYARAMPNNVTLLVDTFDTLEGVRHAIEIGRTLRAAGHSLAGVRLDSGDLAYLSINARRLLDEAGFADTRILASNDLDEHLIESLKHQGAKIDTWGVGTRLATAYEQPALGGVYKLSAIRAAAEAPWQYKLKLSEQTLKISTPGVLNVRRYIDDNGHFIADAIHDISRADELARDGCTIVDPVDMTRRKTIPAGTRSEDLLVPIFRRGRRVYDPPRIEESRSRTIDQLSHLHPTIKRFENPHIYPVGLEKNLHEMKTELILKRGGRGDQMNALIVVDVQNDFLPGGTLAVREGDAILPVVNRLMESGAFDFVVATQDWHPPDHGSFAVNHPGKKVYERIDLSGLPQTLWPAHCVQGTRGAELSSALNRERLDEIFRKGTDRAIDSYSGFFDNGHRKATGLSDYLRSKNVTTVFICGLATDYCANFTAMDAVQLGFQATLIVDACRGVNVKPSDSSAAIEAMRQAGIKVASSDDVLADFR